MGHRYTIEFYQDVAERWRCRVRHRNGNIIFSTSEGDGYARRGVCQRVVCNVLDAPKSAFRATVIEAPKRKGRR